LSTRAIIYVALAVVACAGILALSVIWRGSALPPSLEYAGDPSLGSERPLAIVHYRNVLSPFELIVKIAAPILALIGVAALTARVVRRRAALIGTGSAVLSALLGIALLRVYAAPNDQLRIIPPIESLAAVAGISALLGAVGVGAVLKWWPNNAMDRTRER
jgi:hypothetical protein